MINYSKIIKYIIILFVFINFANATDPISVIQYPVTTRPAILKAGDQLSIICEASSSSSGWQARIFTDFNEVVLPVNPVFDQNTQQWALSTSIPANTPFELYNLEVTAIGINDQVKHAVKIIQNIKDNYYFVHLPDLHLPSVSWIGYYDDNNTVPEFLKISQELQLINPEFVIQTGDVVDNGQVEEQYQIAQELISQLQNPIFITGGNHDLWYDGHENWHKYFNKVMNYSFNYGKHYFAGMEMYDIPTETFTTEQMEWLQSSLQASINSNDQLRILFYHYDESRQIDSDFVDNFELDMLLYGHTHINGVGRLGTRQALNLNTSFTMNNNGEYRLIKIANDNVQEYPVISFENLTVDYSPVNNGSSWQVKAIIKNKNPVSFENGLIKFFVRKDATGYQVTGGQIAQVIFSDNQDIYYVNINIPANSEQEVLIESLNPSGNFPPEILTKSPEKDTTIFAGVTTGFSITSNDLESSNLNISWYQDNVLIQEGVSPSLNFIPDKTFTGQTELTVHVSDGEFYDEHIWFVEVKPFADRPVLQTSIINFFPHNESLTLEWFEPFSINARLEYGLSPGNYTGSISETEQNSVSFTPSLVGMGLGLYYCQISDGNISSDPFPIIIECPDAPQMLAPLGDIQSLSPTFSWEKVPGVPYYMVICSDQEILINEDPETGEITVEGANPIWATLKSENDVPYGVPDPSGTFTSVPAPLVPGNSYWWVVLNCYGNAAELTSPVQSGISKFTVDLPPPDLSPPVLTSPEHNSTLKGETITFQWQAVENVTAYHFYPFKIEQESGIETARAIWENIIATTNEEFEFQAGNLLIEGKYRWKVAVVAENGMEVHSETRDFYYEAPSATVTIRTYDGKNTNNTNDDAVLPRVKITYSAIDGIYNGLPLSTDLHGIRENYKTAPGVYQFKVEKENYDTLVDTLTFEDGENYNLYFRLNPSKSKLTGIVIDNLGESTSDATISAQHSLHQEITKVTQTDALGNFSLSLIPGPYQIEVKKSGYENSPAISISVSSGEVKSLEYPIEITKNTNLISGTVVNTSQQGILGAQVTIFNSNIQFEKTTNSSGHFDFVVANGSWTLKTSKEGFVSPLDRNFSVSGGSNLTISPPITLTPNAGIIQGQVFDGFRLISDVTIKAFPTSGSTFETKSDSYGQFSLNVLSGIYTIHAEKTGYTFNQTIQVSLEAGETNSGIEIIIKPVQSVIIGNVTTDGFNPLNDVKVSNTSVSSFTSHSGTYELGVDYGNHVISALKEGYTSSPPETLVVAPGQIVEQVNFILTPNASVIKGRITGPSGGISGASIDAQNSISVQTKSDENGFYILNVKSGLWRISISKDGFLPLISDSILIGVGQTTEEVNFTLTPNISTIQGIIIDKTTGQAISNAEIIIVSKNLSTTTNVDGTFSLVVEPGEYELEITKPGYQTIQTTTGILEVNSNNNVNATLEELPASFTGNVWDKNGAPLAEAIIFAVNGTDTFKTVSIIDGSFRLDVKSGIYLISASKTDYKTGTISETQVISAGESKSLPGLTLEQDLGNIIGKVLEKSTKQPISNVRVQATTNSVLTAQIQSKDGGSFQFIDESGKQILVPGTYSLIANKSGFISDTLHNIIVEGSKEVSVQLELEKNLGEITGKVVSDVGPEMGATITAHLVSSQQLFTTISGEDGNFILKGLPQGSYEIQVAKTGFTNLEPKIVNLGSYVQLTLTKNNGRILGTITDVETTQPISGVTVSADDQHGNNGGGRTSSTGNYEISELPKIYSYRIQIRKSGYSAISYGPVEITNSTQLDFQLQRIYGNISGKVEDENQLPLANVIVKLNSQIFSAIDTTNSNGQFQFNHLAAIQYQISAIKIGLKSDPIEQIISLWQGGNVENVLFTMKDATAASIQIIGSDNISNSKLQQYSFTAATSDQREASVQPKWEISLPAGIDSLNQAGLLDPSDDYLGSIKLKLTDLHSQVYATKQISIHQVVKLGHTSLNITNKQGIELVLQDSSVVQNIVIQLRKPNFADVRRNTRSYQIVGDIYEFTPANFKLIKPAELTLPVPLESERGELIIGKWNTQWLEWETLEDQIKGNNQLTTTIEKLGRYAILAKSEPLGVKNIKTTPNPFSPETGPVEIEYEISSDQTPQPQVSIKSYNMIGDLVKTLLEFEPKIRGLNKINWDGFTNYNQMAKNGRYVLHFQVRDITGTKEKLKPFVLIK